MLLLNRGYIYRFFMSLLAPPPSGLATAVVYRTSGPLLDHKQKSYSQLFLN